MNESYAETKSTVSGLSKLKFSGYIQGRYDWRDDSISGVDAQGRVTNFNRFEVRRGRLKAMYSGDNAEYLLQIDATGDGVVLKDAEATFVDTWTPLGLRFTMGQFKVPVRLRGPPVVGRSRDARARARHPGAVPGRARSRRPPDRHATSGSTSWPRSSTATSRRATPSSTRFDNNRYFDTYLRVGADFDFIVVHLSGQFGEKLGTTVANAALTIADKNMDGIIQADEVTPAATNVTMRRFGIWRFGADARVLLSTFPRLGGLALKGELVLSQDTNKDFRGVAGRPVPRHQGLRLDPDREPEHRRLLRLRGAPRPVESQPRRRRELHGMPADGRDGRRSDKITTLGLGPLLFVSANLKASAIYEHLWRDASLALGATGVAPSASVPSDQLTLQLQARF